MAAKKTEETSGQPEKKVVPKKTVAKKPSPKKKPAKKTVPKKTAAEKKPAKKPAKKLKRKKSAPKGPSEWKVYIQNRINSAGKTRFVPSAGLQEMLKEMALGTDTVQKLWKTYSGAYAGEISHREYLIESIEDFIGFVSRHNVRILGVEKTGKKTTDDRELFKELGVDTNEFGDGDYYLLETKGVGKYSGPALADREKKFSTLRVKNGIPVELYWGLPN